MLLSLRKIFWVSGPIEFGYNWLGKPRTQNRDTRTGRRKTRVLESYGRVSIEFDGFSNTLGDYNMIWSVLEEIWSVEKLFLEIILRNKKKNIPSKEGFSRVIAGELMMHVSI